MPFCAFAPLLRVNDRGGGRKMCFLNLCRVCLYKQFFFKQTILSINISQKTVRIYNHAVRTSAVNLNYVAMAILPYSVNDHNE